MNARIQESRGRGAFAYAACERYAAAALAFASVVILSRLLTPEEVGTFVTGFAIASLIQSLREFGASSYLVRSHSPDEDAPAAFGLALVASAAAALIIYAASGRVARFYGNPQLSEVLVVCSALCLVQPLGLPARALLRRDMNFRALFWVNTLSASGGLATSVYFAWTGLGHLSAPLGALAGACLSGLLLAVHSPRYVFMRPSLQAWRPVAAFGSYSTAASFLADIGMNAPAYILGRVLGFAEVALYNRAQNLLRQIAQVALSPLVPAVLPTLSRAVREARDVKRIYHRLTSIYLVFAWPILGLLAITAHDLVELLLGPSWSASAPVVQILCVGAMVWAPVTLSGDMFTATGQVKTALLRELAIQPLRVVIVYVAAQFGLLFVAAAQILVHAYGLVVTQTLLRRRFGFAWRDLAAASWQSAAVTAAALLPPAAVSACGLTSDSALANLVLLAALSGIGWIAAAAVLQHPVTDHLVAAIHPLLSRMQGQRVLR